jgi:hypothetical protein
MSRGCQHSPSGAAPAQLLSEESLRMAWVDNWQLSCYPGDPTGNIPPHLSRLCPLGC